MGKLADFFKSIAGICETRPLDPALWKVENGRIHIQLSRVPALQQPDGAVYLKGRGLQYPVLIVRKPDNAFLACADRCTHIGHRKLDPVPGQNRLRCCSVNHSTYDYQGKRLSGPAKKNLTLYEAEQEGDALWVVL